jgi:hypothetical protein
MKQALLLSIGLTFAASLTAQTPRLSLYEEFTGETCGTMCLNQSRVERFTAIPNKCFENRSYKVAGANSCCTIKHPGHFYQTNKAEIDWRYRSPASGGYGYASQNSATAAITSQGVNSAPSGRIDGQHQWVFGAQSDHPAYMTSGVISTAQIVYLSFFYHHDTRMELQLLGS